MNKKKGDLIPMSDQERILVTIALQRQADVMKTKKNIK